MSWVTPTFVEIDMSAEIGGLVHTEYYRQMLAQKHERPLTLVLPSLALDESGRLLLDEQAESLWQRHGGRDRRCGALPRGLRAWRQNRAL